MTDGVLERLIRRDRLIVLAALIAVIAVAWLYLASLGSHRLESAAPGGGAAMPGMDMAAASHGSGTGAALAPWSAAEFLLMFAMWAVMMIGMMTPSAAPMLLLYARVARHANERAQPFAPTGWFAGGYLLAWIAFAALATSLQWMFEQAALLTPAMASANRAFAGVLLVVAGIYQWTPLKEACLGRCRSPLAFIQSSGGFRGDPAGSVRLGLRHGAFCVGCCWGLMLLLFVGGVMNLAWVALLAVVVLAEKVAPPAWRIDRWLAALLAAAALWLLVS